MEGIIHLVFCSTAVRNSPQIQILHVVTLYEMNRKSLFTLKNNTRQKVFRKHENASRNQ